MQFISTTTIMRRFMTAVPALLLSFGLVASVSAQSLKAQTRKPAPQGTLNSPQGLAVDINGNIYAANYNAGVTVYNSNGKLTGTITNETANPVAVGVAFGGNVYVANSGNSTVAIYNSNLQFTSIINDSALRIPVSMYVDGNNDAWVLDSYGTVHVYLQDTTPAGSMTLGGTAIGPWGSNVSVWGVPGGNGYAQYFQNVGEALHEGVNISNDFMTSPLAGGEAEDSIGQQYVTDIAHDQVQIWASNGTEVGSFNTASQPAGIAVDSVRKRIYVALPISNEIAAYSMTAPYKLLGNIR